jgi:hypothetical protein
LRAAERRLAASLDRKTAALVEHAPLQDVACLLRDIASITLSLTRLTRVLEKRAPSPAERPAGPFIGRLPTGTARPPNWRRRSVGAMAAC